MAERERPEAWVEAEKAKADKIHTDSDGRQIPATWREQRQAREPQGMDLEGKAVRHTPWAEPSESDEGESPERQTLGYR